MLIAHKITLDLNHCQATYMARAAGTARFAYNWALAQWKRQYEAWKLDSNLPKPSQAALRRQLNAIKHEQFPWMLEVLWFNEIGHGDKARSPTPESST